MASKNQGSVNKGNQKGGDQKPQPESVKSARRASFKGMGGNPNPISKRTKEQDPGTRGETPAAAQEQQKE